MCVSQGARSSERARERERMGLCVFGWLIDRLLGWFGRFSVVFVSVLVYECVRMLLCLALSLSPRVVSVLAVCARGRSINASRRKRLQNLWRGECRRSWLLLSRLVNCCDLPVCLPACFPVLLSACLLVWLPVCLPSCLPARCPSLS